MNTPNARFWVYVNCDWVKITLGPGECRSWETSGPTDEGFSSNWEIWEHEGEYLRNEWGEDGRDCDGRYSRGGTRYADIMRLHENEAYEQPAILTPFWEVEEKHQRDYAAEAAGY